MLEFFTIIWIVLYHHRSIGMCRALQRLCIVCTPICRPARGWMAVVFFVCLPVDTYSLQWAGGKVNCDRFQFPKPGQIVTRQARVWMNFNPSVCRTRPHHWIGPIKSPYITGNADWIYRNSFKYYSSWRASSRIAISQLSWQTGMRKLKQRPFAAPSVLMFSCPQCITNPRWMIIVSHWRLLVGYPRLHLDGNLWLQLTIWQNGSLGINIHVPRFKSSLLLGLLLFSFLLLVFR